MARYAERDCSDCGVILPANELVAFTERQLSGSTTRSGVRTGVRGGIGFSSGGSQRYRHVKLRLCAQCAQARVDADKRARFIANLRIIAILGLVFFAIIAFVSETGCRTVWGRRRHGRESHRDRSRAIADHRRSATCTWRGERFVGSAARRTGVGG